MECRCSGQIGLYLDNELSGPARAAVEEHLATCASCRGYLEELARLSGLIREAPLPAASEVTLARIQKRCRAAEDERRVARVAAWLTAAAAVVLVGALLPPLGGSADEPAAATSELWQIVAVSPSAAMQEGADQDPILLAQWIAEDLSPAPQR